MKYTDMIKGELYSLNNGSYIYLFRFDRMEETQLYIGAYGHSFKKTPIFYRIGGCWGSGCLDTIRKTTQEEKEWFIACEIAGKAVKKPEKIYEIY